MQLKVQYRQSKGFISPLLILIVLAVIAIAIIVIFVLDGMGGRQVITDQIPAISQPADSVIEELNQQSSSDEISAIEKDIDNTDLKELDQGLDQINSDLREL